MESGKRLSSPTRLLELIEEGRKESIVRGNNLKNFSNMDEKTLEDFFNVFYFFESNEDEIYYLPLIRFHGSFHEKLDYSLGDRSNPSAKINEFKELGFNITTYSRILSGMNWKESLEWPLNHKKEWRENELKASQYSSLVVQYEGLLKLDWWLENKSVWFKSRKKVHGNPNLNLNSLFRFSGEVSKKYPGGRSLVKQLKNPFSKDHIPGAHIDLRSKALESLENYRF